MRNRILTKHGLPQGAIACSFLASSLVSAQEASPSDIDGDYFELSPFVINASEDVGWVAQNTLAGSRLNSSLRDTPAVLDVVTTELIDELGIDNFADALALSANQEETFGDQSNPSGALQFSFPGASQGLSFNNRGQSAALARNFIATSFRPEHYTVERIDNSSGPNAILFGLGGAGGIANVTTKQAFLSKDTNSVQLRFDEYGSATVHYDGNRVILEDKLGVRVNAIREKKQGFREWSDNDLKGLHVAFKARLFEHTDINFEFENDLREGLVVDRRPIVQALDAWEGAGSPLYPSNAVTDSFDANIVTRFSNASRWVWVDEAESSFLVNQARSFKSRASSDSPVQDEAYVPFEVNLSGPGGRKTVDHEVFALSVDQRLAEKLYANLALSYESGGATTHQTFFGGTGNNDTFLAADPNLNLPSGANLINPNGVAFELDADNLPLNPARGQSFVEGWWRRRSQTSRVSNAQLSLSYSLDTERFGRHNFVSNFGYFEGAGYSTENTFSWVNVVPSADGSVVGAFNNTVTNGANRVFLRNNVTPGDNRSYHVGDWANLEGRTFQRSTGGDFTTAWVPTTVRDTDNYGSHQLFAVQSLLLDDKLATTVGVRRDDQTTFLNSDRSNDKGDTKSFGAVYKFNQTVAAYFNKSNSFKGGNVQPHGPDGLAAPQVDGEGEDFGFKFSFADSKYTLNVGYYEASENNTSTLIGTSGTPLDDLEGHWNSIFEALNLSANGPRLLDTSDSVALAALRSTYSDLRPVWLPLRDLFDSSSSGYELRFNANPVKGLRLRATYAYTDRSNEDLLKNTRVALAQLSEYLADLRTANPSVDVDGLLRIVDETTSAVDDVTLGQHFAQFDALVHASIDTQSADFGSSRHRASVNVGYDLGGRLKGLSVNAGAQYRAGNRVALYLIEDPSDASVVIGESSVFGEDDLTFDFGLRYRAKTSIFGEGTDVTYQLAVKNLFQSEAEARARFYETVRVPAGDPLPALEGRIPNNTFIHEPRTISGSVKFDF